MLNKYPLWKYFLLLGVLLAGLLYALPNLFGEDPAVQVIPTTGYKIEEPMVTAIQEELQNANISFRTVKQEGNVLLVRLKDESAQLKAKEVVKTQVGDNYITALNLAPKTPFWLEAIGAKPMKLGLDLRGGVHFLMQVDLEGALDRYVDSALGEMRSLMREHKVRYKRLHKLKDGVGIMMTFDDQQTMSEAQKLIKKSFQDYDLMQKKDGQYQLICHIKQARIQEINNSTVEKSITTLRNRVNELGVAESVVQRQGAKHIVVQLPGIQDTARAKDILGKTATLAFYLEAKEASDYRNTNVAPAGTKWYELRESGRPVLLSKRVILTGDSIIGAMVGADGQTGQPAVHVNVANKGLAIWQKVTAENVGKGMGVVYQETKTDFIKKNDEIVKQTRTDESLISFATIRSPLGSRFQITGLSLNEAQDLSILLRAGSLPATITIVEERTVGPSLGMENIRLGQMSIVVGMALVLVCMVLYYSVFGVIANLALMINVVLLIAILSMVGATLTLPGIAGIVLTIGMAVDANVLIFERIREELRNGVSAQAAIHSGFERALTTIVDANLTTLIVAIILFSVGTGPVRGFAVTLSIGILTSMLTAITGTRAMVNLMYGGRTIQKLRVGI